MTRARLAADLVERGFVARGGAWRRADLVARLEDGWLVLAEPAAGPDPLVADAAWAGPRRLLPLPGGQERVLELPPAAVADADAVRAALDWALAPGTVPAAHAADAVVAVADERWTLRAGSLLAQVRPLHGDPRHGLELPLSARPVAGLAPARAAWLHALLRDARRSWRLVRALLVDGVPLLRVDLRTVPEPLAERLGDAALDALRHAGARLLEPLDLLLDPELACRALCADGFAPDRVVVRARPAPNRRASPALPH